MFDVKKAAEAQKEYITNERRYLHAHPELGTKEINTTKHIVEELQKMGIETITFPDITGAIGIIKGSKPGKTVMLRADIDALPIQENDHGQSYISTTPGVMHACGHDCHTAMLLGAAKILSEHRDDIHGTVKLIFQMAEEIGTESRHYVEKGCLDDVDAIFGMHIWALIDSGHFNLEDGERMACSDRITIKVKGKASHGSAPQEGKDAIVAASAIVMGLQTIVSRSNDPQNSLVVTVGAMNGGQQTNVLAEEVELVGTVRTFNKEFRKHIPELIEEKAKNIAKAYGCEAECIYFFGPAPLINDHKELNDFARSAVTQMMGDQALMHLDKQMGAEDFSVYMEKVPGVFGFLGCRNKEKGICCVHHHPDFQVDEDVFPAGTGIYVQFALNFLG
jgi:amidohydrolase